MFLDMKRSARLHVAITGLQPETEHGYFLRSYFDFLTGVVVGVFGTHVFFLGVFVEGIFVAELRRILSASVLLESKKLINFTDSSRIHCLPDVLTISQSATHYDEHLHSNLPTRCQILA